MLNKLSVTFICFTLISAISTVARAETIIPQGALIPSSTYYTDVIGGGIGSPLVMTGGGNAANVGGSRNDDGFSGPISLGFTLNFFGVDYTQFWANNNGNISFGGGIDAFTPEGPVGADQPVISPFFADVDTRMTIAQEEIFGPVVSFISYDDIDDAITKANDTIYGLHGAIYTADPERGYQLARRVRSGSVTVNGLIVDYKMPFGGFKQSGFGREGGIEGLENYFEVKTIYFG